MRSTLSIGRPAVAQRKIWGVETASSRLAFFLQEPKKTCDKTHKIHKIHDRHEINRSLKYSF